MAFISWDENYCVGVREFDNHHKKLVSLTNDLHESMKVGKSKEILSDIIKELVDYTAKHFAAEEKYMQQYNYPDMQQHKVEHEKFVAKVIEFQKGYEAGKVLLTMEVNSFLKDWLLNHILKTDKEYGQYFNEKGLK